MSERKISSQGSKGRTDQVTMKKATEGFHTPGNGVSRVTPVPSLEREWLLAMTNLIIIYRFSPHWMKRYWSALTIVELRC